MPIPPLPAGLLATLSRKYPDLLSAPLRPLKFSATLEPLTFPAAVPIVLSKSVGFLGPSIGICACAAFAAF